MGHKLRAQDIINLAAPHTWGASVMPAVLAAAFSCRIQGSLPPDLLICLFLPVVLMQSAVNTLNDYADFVKGTDTKENSPDAEDAVIVYGLEPRTARRLGIGFLSAAVIPGFYAVFRCGIVPLVIGVLGGLVILAYSSGRFPLSYLPLGEIVSGFVMGGLIPLAGVQMLTGQLRFLILLKSLPLIIGIGMVMLSNNGCDIDRDLDSGRRTLPCLLGKRKTGVLYRVLLLLWLLSPVVLLLAGCSAISALVYFLCLPVSVSTFSRQFRTPLSPETRGAVMSGVNSLLIMLSFSYAVAILTGG